jgi:hypothetical protein
MIDLTEFNESDQKRPLPCPLLVLFAAASLILLASCTKSTHEKELIGSWQIKVPVPFAPVFTYSTNHTVSITMPKTRGLESQAMLGDWKLEGDQLTTVMRSVTNQYGAIPPGMIPGNSEQVTITKLNDSVMVWRSSLLGRTTTLRRVSLPTAQASSMGHSSPSRYE